MMMDATELIVEERDHEIQRIARSISELSRVFKELAGLVIDQGTVVDRIDYNMEQVGECIEKHSLQFSLDCRLSCECTPD